MERLQLRVLGDLEVIRGETVLPLPPSRKTRGLLAYLALQQRPLRREQLCELLWEIPDDPRGSLRWSLSKIRKLVDDDGCPRILADRSTVAFDTSAVDIDVAALHAAARNSASASVDELVRMAEQCRGSFLEGLDLPDFHDFHAWCIGERERTVRSQARVLAELGRRLADQPERALDYALALVSLTPFDEMPRAELIRLLVQLDRRQEAQHQYEVGLEKLAEVGAADSGALRRALRERERPRAAPASGRAPLAHATIQERALVGRERELDRLAALIGELPGRQQARVLLLRGDPGMGKSHLLQVAAAMARQQGTGLFKTSAYESEMMRPFGVWKDALRRGLPENNAASRLLAGNEEMTREQVFDSLVQVFASQLAKYPVVAICDDVHWADESSFGALRHVIGQHARQPLLFVIASRESELKDNAAAMRVLRDLRASGMLEELRLEPLAEEEIVQLIRRQLPEADAASLGRQSGGNPLLALELARAGVEGGGSLADLVNERVSRMEASAAQVLQWAAVLAPQISLLRLQQVCALAQGAIDKALEQAEQQGILHPGERGLRFAHELIRRSIYDAISPARQRSMHRRVAELLEVDAGVDLELAADLAHHARRSGDPRLAGKAMVSAGRLCLRFYANDQALALYREGMGFAAQLGDAQRVCLTLELAEIRVNAQPVEDWQAAVDEFVNLAEQAMDHGSRSHARLGYQIASYLRWLHGEVRDAKRFSLQAERVSRGATDEAQVLGLAEAAKCLAMLERDLSRADAMLMEAAALAQRARYECHAIPLARGILHYYGDRFDAATDSLEDARTLSKAAGDRMAEYLANEYLTVVEMERRDCVAAREYAGNMADIGARLREGSERPYALALAALCRYRLDGDDSALAPALDELRVADAKQRLTFVLNRAAISYLEQGDPRRARDCAREALDLARIMERPSEMLQACLTLEAVHRLDPAIAPDSLREPIERLLAGSVAGWARKRGAALLDGWQ